MSSSNSPCAACKIQRRKCTQECIFAPYFPPDKPLRFVYVHKVFGASNVGKILNELSASHREDAVMSLAYEAEARLRDPVYGCVGHISVLQHRLRQLHTELNNAKKELATYVGPQALLPILQPNSAPGSGLLTHLPANPSPSSSVFPFEGFPLQQMMGFPAHGQQQIFDVHAQQLAADVVAGEQQMMMHQQELLRFNGGGGGGGYEVASGSESGFGHMSSACGAISPSLALGPADQACHEIQVQAQQAEHLHHNHDLHHQLQAQLMLSPLTPQAQQSPLSQKQHKPESEGR